MKELPEPMHGVIFVGLWPLVPYSCRTTIWKCLFRSLAFKRMEVVEVFLEADSDLEEREEERSWDIVVGIKTIEFYVLGCNSGFSDADSFGMIDEEALLGPTSALLQGLFMILAYLLKNRAHHAVDYRIGVVRTRSRGRPVISVCFCSSCCLYLLQLVLCCAQLVKVLRTFVV